MKSRRIAFVVHCILNTNAVAEGVRLAEQYHGIVTEVVDFLKENRIGVVQMPCPEQGFFGYKRKPQTKTEMNRLFRKHCSLLAKEIVKSMEEYEKTGCKIVFLLGKRGSPSCGVLTAWTKTKGKKVEAKGKGIFVEEIMKQFKKQKTYVPLIDFERKKVSECVKRMRNLV